MSTKRTSASTSRRGCRRDRSFAAAQCVVAMGVHPFGDPRITDEFAAEVVPIDARDFHVYAAKCTPERVEFYMGGEHVKTVGQSPSCPM